MLPLIIVLLFLLISSLLTPYFETRLMVRHYELLNGILGKICHQYPSRCFYVFGSNMGLCARCFSVYSAIMASSIFYIFVELKSGWRSRAIVTIILIMPLLIDGLTQYYHLRVSTNSIRGLTGVMAGLGSSNLLLPFYVSVVRGFKELGRLIIERRKRS